MVNEPVGEKLKLGLLDDVEGEVIGESMGKGPKCRGQAFDRRFGVEERE